MFQNGSGIMMLLKSMGLNPDEIMGRINGAAQEAQKVMLHFNGRLDRLEKQNAQILALLEPVKMITPADPEKEFKTNGTVSG